MNWRTTTATTIATTDATSGTSHELKIGLTGPGRQKADLGTASPFLPLLGRSSGMGEAWRTSAPSSAGAVACVCVGQIAL